jgi:cell division protein FtsB
MEGRFYRNIRKPRWWKEKTAQFVNQPKLLALVVGGLILGSFILFNNKGIVARIHLEIQRREAKENLRRAEEETKQLQTQLNALEGDKKTIEKVARERYGMAREGETVYRLKPQQ